MANLALSAALKQAVKDNQDREKAAEQAITGLQEELKEKDKELEDLKAQLTSGDVNATDVQQAINDLGTSASELASFIPMTAGASQPGQQPGTATPGTNDPAQVQAGTATGVVTGTAPDGTSAATTDPLETGGAGPATLGTNTEVTG